MCVEIKTDGVEIAEFFEKMGIPSEVVSPEDLVESPKDMNCLVVGETFFCFDDEDNFTGIWTKAGGFEARNSPA